tara:strand:+ start:571 stop:777 length:207 start_codon:yes stop_codon:yes gene_type:complete
MNIFRDLFKTIGIEVFSELQQETKEIKRRLWIKREYSPKTHSLAEWKEVGEQRRIRWSSQYMTNLKQD